MSISWFWFKFLYIAINLYQRRSICSIMKKSSHNQIVRISIFLGTRQSIIESVVDEESTSQSDSQSILDEWIWILKDKNITRKHQDEHSLSQRITSRLFATKNLWRFQSKAWLISHHIQIESEFLIERTLICSDSLMIELISTTRWFLIFHREYHCLNTWKNQLEQNSEIDTKKLIVNQDIGFQSFWFFSYCYS